MRSCTTRSRLSTALVTLLLALFIAGDLETGSRGQTAPSVRAAQSASTLFADLTAATDFRASIASSQRLPTKAGDHELALPAALVSLPGRSGRPDGHAAHVVAPRAGSGWVPEARAPPTDTPIAK
jgi:hypothetical protein